jgi:hypothetical protein
VIQGQSAIRGLTRIASKNQDIFLTGRAILSTIKEKIRAGTGRFFNG